MDRKGFLAALVALPIFRTRETTEPPPLHITSIIQDEDGVEIEREVTKVRVRR